MESKNTIKRPACNRVTCFANVESDEEEGKMECFILTKNNFRGGAPRSVRFIENQRQN